MKSQRPQVIFATGYPLHADAARGYLNGAYGVIPVGHSLWQDGLQEIEQLLAARPICAVLVDDTFPQDAVMVAARVKAIQPTVGLIFLTHQLNIFTVLRCLEAGYIAYLYLGDPLAQQLQSVIEHARRGERYLSHTVRGLYERYICYRGLFTSLPKALISTFKLMGEGLSVQQMVARTGLRPEVIYRRQYRLRQHFGVDTNDELVTLIHEMYAEPTAFAPLASS